MPYYKNRRGRGYKKAKQQGGKRGRVYGAAAYQLWKDVKWLKSVINVEQKFHDRSSVLSATETMNNILINGIAQGDTQTTRDGASIKVMRGIVSGYVEYNPLGNSAQTVRVVVVRRAQNASSAPGVAINDIFEGPGTGAAAVTAFYNKVAMGGYHVLCDKKITVNADYPRKYFKCYIRGGWHTKFTGSGGAVGDISNNNLHVLYVGDQTSTNYPNFYNNTRIVYTDN